MMRLTEEMMDRRLKVLARVLLAASASAILA
jgi:hypothetical protein